MSCGASIIIGSGITYYSLTCDVFGSLVTTRLVGAVIPTYSPFVMKSASLYWLITVGNDGALIATNTSPTAAITSLGLGTNPSYNLTIDDTGTFATFNTGLPNNIVSPMPPGISFSHWPNVGLTSTVAGGSPLVINADGSIWSCLLNQFINVDTTNIITVLDE